MSKRRPLRPAQRAEEIDAVNPLLRERVRHLQAVGAAHARAQLHLQRVVGARDVVLHREHLRELRHRPRVRRVDRAGCRQVQIHEADLIAPERVDVVDVERSDAVDLPAEADSAVQRGWQLEVVRNQRADVGRGRRRELAERLPAEHALDVREELHRVRIGDEHRAARRLVHRARLEPRPVARHVSAPPAAQDERSGAAHVERGAEPRLKRVEVHAGVGISAEARERRVERILQQVAVKPVDSHVGVGVVTQPGVDVEPRPQLPLVLDVGRNLRRFVVVEPRQLHRERRRIRAPIHISAANARNNREVDCFMFTSWDTR